MPIYSFRCDKCEKEFEEFQLIKKHTQSLPCSCGGLGVSFFSGVPNVIFSDPKDTSKWDNFSYRAGFNLEKAKQERRTAEQAALCQNPYNEIDDCNLKGVFDEGGADISSEELPGLNIPT